jgi:hypothetical protein
MNKVKTVRLEERIVRLKSDIAALKAFKKENDSLQRQYEKHQARFKTIFNHSSLGDKFIAPYFNSLARHYMNLLNLRCSER